MATAIVNGLISQQNGKADFINVFDVSSEKCDIIAKLGVNICKTGEDVVKSSDIIVLAVKPQNYPEVLESLKSAVSLQKTFVSIAAGISIDFVQRGLDCKCPVVRVMPNTPLLLKRELLRFVRLIISAMKTSRLFMICLLAAAFANTLQKSI